MSGKKYFIDVQNQKMHINVYMCSYKLLFFLSPGKYNLVYNLLFLFVLKPWTIFYNKIKNRLDFVFSFHLQCAILVKGTVHLRERHSLFWLPLL